MDILRICYIIEHRANPSIKKKFTSNPKNKAFFEKIFNREVVAPHPSPSMPRRVKLKCILTEKR